MALKLSDLDASDVTLVSGGGGAQAAAAPGALKISSLSPGDVQLVQNASDADDGSSLSDYGKRALGAISQGMQKIDSYTGAPVRAALYAAENSPTEMGRPVAAAKAFASQFGQDPSRAATGQQIVEGQGIPKGSIAAKGLGVVADALSNPTGYLPVGEALGAGVRGIGSAVGLGAKGAQAASEVAPVAADVADQFVTAPANAVSKATRVAGTAAETMTGVDRNIAANYMANTDRINQIVDHYNGPEGYQEAAHANDIRNNWRSVIQQTRQAMNDKISAALNTPQASEATIDAKPIQDALNDAISKAHPVTQTKDLAALNDLQDKLGQMAGENGKISLKDLQAFKKYASDVASPSYDAAGNAIFPNGDFAAKMAKNVAGSARDILIKNGPKPLAQAESTLADLHAAEDTMNSTLLKDNGAVHAINRAGMNSGGTEATSLRNLSSVVQKANNISGSDLPTYNFEQDAKDFATARAFAAPKFTPDWNGKSLLRAGVGAAAGTLASQVVPIPMEYAALGGAALASPGMLKAGINATNLAGRAVGAIPRGAVALGRGAYTLATSPAGEAALDIGGKAALAPSYGATQTGGGGSNIAGASQVNRSPARGPDAWAQRGAQNLGLNDADAQAFMQSPKARELLIQASDLKPGSKAMQNILKQIQAMKGAR